LSSTSVVKNEVASAISKSIVSGTDAEIVVPSVKGMSLRKAIRVLQRTGLESKFAGSGRVVWQSPNPGAVVKTGEICSIGLE
jgi:cell division protein FtsI (penicillin-binding protein 3)